MTLEAIVTQLEQRLSPGRFHHSLGVMQTATILALIHGVDPAKAALAGMLHDCGRQFPRPQQWEYLLLWGLAPRPEDEQYAAVWHSWLSPEVARREYGVHDREVLDALRDHTTGAAAMSPLSEIVFVADTIEPLRRFDGVERLRVLARSDLRRAVAECLLIKRAHVEARQFPLHPFALEAMAFYCR